MKVWSLQPKHRIQKETLSLVYFAISLILYKISQQYLVIIFAFVIKIRESLSGLLHSFQRGLPSVQCTTIYYLYNFMKQTDSEITLLKII